MTHRGRYYFYVNCSRCGEQVLQLRNGVLKYCDKCRREVNQEMHRAAAKRRKERHLRDKTLKEAEKHDRRISVLSILRQANH